MSEKTIGEFRVRTDFNVGGSSIVDEIKTKSAELINLLQALRDSLASKEGNIGEMYRLIAIAQTTYEEAAMWAVKAATA